MASGPMTLYTIPPLTVFSHARATTEIYTLSLHDALPISTELLLRTGGLGGAHGLGELDLVAALGHLLDGGDLRAPEDRKSTRLNSSHSQISYAVFCLKKKSLDLSSQPVEQQRAVLPILRS